MGHLERQLAERKPLYVFCLGNVAVQSFCGDHAVDVKGLRGRVLQIHGIPTVVSYHPLAVRRRPNLRPFFINDFHLLYKSYMR
jgi:DNA polymerase